MVKQENRRAPGHVRERKEAQVDGGGDGFLIRREKSYLTVRGDEDHGWTFFDKGKHEANWADGPPQSTGLSPRISAKP